ncbi:MAG TPA: OmpA family protein [Thermoanaerobaculia bacterium]|nr:OmpA family protein [Thermoanaerobaculia bacterium]
MVPSSSRTAAVVLAASTLFGCAAKTIEMKMAVDVVSEPERASVTYKGKNIGETPKSFEVTTFDDVASITATKADLDVVEKRIRILSPDKAVVVFHLGKGGISPVAKKLNLTRVLVFEYAEKVCFDSAKADLKPDAIPVLARQAEILNRYFPKAQVYVCGYTDSTGSDAFNDKLSLQRAETVRNFLVNQSVDPARLKTQGFGKQFEVAPNTTAEGRALNRRTEVILPE